jgi:hypothetical protein
VISRGQVPFSNAFNCNTSINAKNAMNIFFIIDIFTVYNKLEIVVSKILQLCLPDDPIISERKEKCRNKQI